MKCAYWSITFDHAHQNLPKMADETDGAQLPDLQHVSDRAREQFSDMLSEVEGKKDIVIQSELMALLDHVTPLKFLRK